ncbi:carbon-nitrogen family hydrolase [Streptomyces sp. NPDC002992]|uniref:carbon-nitrogen family hydrolase n=1 Tax=Streptomyces sp. NPDC002992 TaxID=3154273 RepID=UPI0033BB3DD8
MRASLIQIAVDPDESVESRRVRVADLVRQERGAADLVVLPELWPMGAFAYESFAAESEPVNGPTYEAMASAARDAEVWLHAGSIVEAAGGALSAGGVLYNTSLVFSPAGEPVATYRKIHRFGFDKGEAVMMAAGDELVTVALPGLTVGVGTCYDLRFPELFRGLVDAGAQAFVVPAGWPARRRSHWTLLARARAVENQAYMLACGTAGTHAGVEQAGHSIVVDPWGEVLAEAGPDEEILRVELDPAKVTTTREQFPALKDRVLGVARPRRDG